MGFRFRRRIGPKGLKINLTQNGISSVSLGGRGLSYNIPVNRKGGDRLTVGIPGSGLSWSEQAPTTPFEREEQRIRDERQPTDAKNTDAKNGWRIASFFLMAFVPVLVLPAASLVWMGMKSVPPQEPAPRTQKTAADYAAEYKRQSEAALARQKQNQEYARNLAQGRANKNAMNAAGYFQGTRGGCFRYTSGGQKDYVDRSICSSYLKGSR